jgi:hypothetical protein
VELIKLQLNNLKLLASLEIADSIYLSQEELDAIGFDWKGAPDIVNPFLRVNSNSKSCWAEVFGFFIRKPEKAKYPYRIYPPSYSELVLSLRPEDYSVE